MPALIWHRKILIRGRSLTDTETQWVVVFASCETSKRTWSKVSDQGLKFCGAISGRAIFFISTLFVLHQDYKTSPTNWGGQFYPFLGFCKDITLFVNYFVSTFHTHSRQVKQVSLSLFLICNDSTSQYNRICIVLTL